MRAESDELSGLTILVIEDNFLVAETIKDALERSGCEVIGPSPSIARGLPLIRNNHLDGAVLDINLAGELCFPLAAALCARHIPFVFLTGYDDPGIIPPEFGAVHRLSKPFRYDQLPGLIAEGLRQPAAPT